MGCASSATMYEEDDIPGYKSINKKTKNTQIIQNNGKIIYNKTTDDIPGGYRIIENKRNTR